MSEQKTAEELIAEAFERGRQQGAAQEHALWQLAAIGQEIEPSPKPDRPMLSDAQITEIWKREWSLNDHTDGDRSMEPLIDFARACIRADREGQS